MAKKKLPKLSRRTWLNKDKGSAYVYVHGEVEGGYGDYKDDRGVYLWVEIKDCTRQCQLEFDYDSAKEYKQRFVKLQTLRNELDKLEEFMLANPPVRTPRTKKKKSSPRHGTTELIL